MRINRLDLVRYGKFTDGIIDFGSRPVGSPDIHVIYGPNEAGKSTTFDAIVDLIFGIGTTSKYGFLHPFPTMRIGAEVNVGGKDREFIRIKRQQNTLLDDIERILPESDIRSDLGGIDRDAFTTMFSLDDDSLEKGGEGILASRGNLGELLFAASAGLADLSKQLTTIRGCADSFYKYRGKSGALGDLKARLGDLKQQRDALDLQASEYQRLVLECDRLGHSYEQALATRTATQRRIDEIKRTLNALPVLSRLGVLKDRLTNFDEFPVPPETWRQEVQDLIRSDIELRVKSQDAARAIACLEDEVANISIDPAAIAAAGQLEDLQELRSRYVTADKDIPKLTSRAAELSIASILVQLGRPGETSPERLLLGASTVGSLRALISEKSGVDAKRVAAQEELGKVERALRSEAAADVPIAPPELIKAHHSLQATLRALPKGNQEMALRQLSRRRDAASGSLADALAALRPWQGTATELSSLAVPTGSRLEGWKVKFTLAEDRQQASQAELQRLKPEACRLQAEVDILREQAGRIDEATATASRASRERAWAEHRHALNSGTAENFERVMRADDQLTALRLMHFAEMGSLNQLMQRRAAVAADIESQQKASAEAKADIEVVNSEIHLAVGGPAEAGVADDPWELEEWLRKRKVALNGKDDLAAIDQEVAELCDHLEHSKRLLADALKAAKITFPANAEIGALVSVAEEALDAFHSAAAAVERVTKLRDDLKERTHVLEAADEAAQAWSGKWGALCGECWLGEIGEVPSVGAVTEILGVLERLSSAVDARDGLIDRVQKMEKDKILFEEKVNELCSLLGIALDGTPKELCQTIFEKIKTADLDSEREEKLRHDLLELRGEGRKLEIAQERLLARVTQMSDFFGVNNLEEIERSIELAAQRQDLIKTITDAECELIEITGAASVSEVEKLIATTDRSQMEDEIAKLVPVLDDHDVRCRELFHNRSKAQDALDAIGGDGKVAMLEEQRRTTLLEIEESARHYMETRAGVAAAEHALRLYRDRHRSGMMSRASEAFRTISRGAYLGVAAQPGKDGDVLIAVSASGGSKAANELSKGARFQLYLALRVAGYHEFVANRTPIPFVADDIMETFDDFRAEEAFRLFADMGMRGQVIYLTHHRHLTEIARKVCPSVRLHDLEDVGKRHEIRSVAAE